MKAVWRVPFEHGYAKELLVKVHTFNPMDCKLHPESGYVPEVWSKGHDAAIHPECAAVLKTLEDLEPEAEVSKLDALMLEDLNPTSEAAQ